MGEADDEGQGSRNAKKQSPERAAKAVNGVREQRIVSAHYPARSLLKANGVTYKQNAKTPSSSPLASVKHSTDMRTHLCVMQVLSSLASCFAAWFSR